MSKKMLGNLLLTITAMIWGFAFVAQSMGMEYLGPFTFGGIRNGVGALALLPVVMATGRKKEGTPKSAKMTLLGGVCCGVMLFIASTLQQIGMTDTTAGKASFITALYIVMVPVFSLVLGRKLRMSVWLAAGLGIVGLYLLCITESLEIAKGDFLVMLCAPCFAVHILVVDYFAPRGDGVKMSCIQFAMVALLSLPGILLTETVSLQAVWDCKWPILYAGVLSCGVAYTLQILGQEHTEPATASLLMSLEAVFGALGGWLVLGEVFTLREFFGAALVFAAVILAQLPQKKGTASRAE